MQNLFEICDILEYTKPDKLAKTVERFYPDGQVSCCPAAELERWYDLDVPGVRELLRLYIDELVCIFGELDVYRVYASVPCPLVLSTAFNMTSGVRVHTAELCAMIVFQGILGLPPISHSCGNRCAMLENRRLFVENGSLPKPDLVWSFGLLCDECCKTDEILHGMSGVRQINTLCTKSGDDERFAQYEASLREGIEKLCRLSGAQLGDARLAREKANNAAILSSAICCTNAAMERPTLKAGTVSLIQTSQIMAFTNMDRLLDAFSDIRKALRARKPGDSRGWRKLYTYYIPPCVPTLGAAFEDNRISLVGGAAFITKPVKRSHAPDVAGAAAAAWEASMLSHTAEEYAAETANAIKKYSCVGYLNGMFGFDRWLGAIHKLTDREVQRLSDRPVFHCPIDFWGRGFNLSRMETQVESIAYICRE